MVATTEQARRHALMEKHKDIGDLEANAIIDGMTNELNAPREVVIAAMEEVARLDRMKAQNALVVTGQGEYRRSFSIDADADGQPLTWLDTLKIWGAILTVFGLIIAVAL